MAKLLTNDLVNILPPLYSNENLKNVKAVVQFYIPTTAAKWWISEGSFVDEHGSMLKLGPSRGWPGIAIAPDVPSPPDAVDFLCYGFCLLGNPRDAEFGYVSLNELCGAAIEGVPNVERNMQFKPSDLHKIASTVKGRTV